MAFIQERARLSLQKVEDTFKKTDEWRVVEKKLLLPTEDRGGLPTVSYLSKGDKSGLFIDGVWHIVAREAMKFLIPEVKKIFGDLFYEIHKPFGESQDDEREIYYLLQQKEKTRLVKKEFEVTSLWQSISQKNRDPDTVWARVPALGEWLLADPRDCYGRGRYEFNKLGRIFKYARENGNQTIRPAYVGPITDWRS